MLDAQHRPLGTNVVSIGSFTASIVHPREVFQASDPRQLGGGHPRAQSPVGVVLNRARRTLSISRRLREAGELLGIRVLDSIISARRALYSFVDAGRW